MINLFFKSALRIKIIKLILFFLLFILVFSISEKYSQSFHFVDEDDGLVIGSFINKGYRLYTDISTNHQPLVYFTSSMALKIFQPANLYRLMQMARRAMFLYGFFFSLLLLYEFGLPFLTFSVFFESTKFFILGNELLAENLAVYPLIYLIGIIFKIYFKSYKLKKWEKYFFGLGNFLVLFNVLTLVPSLIILDILYLIKIRKFKKPVLGFIIPAAILGLYISPIKYFKETILYNLQSAVPLFINGAPIKTTYEHYKLLVIPLLSFVEADQTIFNIFIQFFSVVLVINFLIILFRNKKMLIFWVFLFLTITLTNTRNYRSGQMFYNGFHLLPWYAAFIFFNLLSLKQLLLGLNPKLKTLILTVFIVGSGFLLFSKDMPYFVKINKQYEHNVSFLPNYLRGEAIKAISQKDDRLAVIPNESLIYWQSGLKLASRQLAYYTWQYEVPELKKEFDDIFQNAPPEFIYAELKLAGQNYLPLLQTVLSQRYVRATKNNLAENIFIRKDKISKITDQQWEEWEKLSFDKITLNAIK